MRSPPDWAPVARASQLLREPRLRGLELAHVEALGLSGEQERQRAQRGPHPVLVADHGDALERRGVTRAKARVGAHRVALDVPGLAPEQVQQPDVASVGDLARSTGSTAFSQSSSSTSPTASKPIVPAGMSVIRRNIRASLRNAQQTLGIRRTPAPGMPTITIAGAYGAYGHTQLQDWINQPAGLNNTLTWQSGKHTMRFGGQYFQNQFWYISTGQVAGS